MQPRMCCFVVVVCAIGAAWPAATFGQTPVPVFEDLLTDSSRIAGQWGSGIFSADGYTLTQCTRPNWETDPLGHPRSEDFIWYDLPGLGSDGSGSIEFDARGLFPDAGVTKNELMATCDSTGLNPATTPDDFYASPYSALLRKDNYTPGTNVDKMKIDAGGQAYPPPGFSERTDVLSWDGMTTYRFRLTWNGTIMRAYRGLPGQTLTLLSPPTPYNLGTPPWAPNILHVQIGSTWRAGPRGIQDTGGAPGTVYSLVRIYEEDIGGGATPLRGWNTTVTTNLGTTDITLGLNRLVNNDGDTTPVTIGGRDARKNLDPSSDYYFYFNAHDYFAYQGNKPDVYISIDYYDTGTGSLTLQYDAASNAYKSGGSVALTGTNTWKQFYYHVSDAYFGNRQNGGADFRILAGAGNTFYLDVVSVSTVTPLPAQASEPIPANLVTHVSRTADLSWAAVQNANSYNVYFGTGNPPAPRGNQTQTAFDPGAIMDPLTTYFWRIDPVNGFGTTTGVVWQFTTQSFTGDLNDDLDVDQEDFGYFQACFSGAGIDLTPGCESADFNVDGDVDQDDFAVFQNCMAGPNRPSGC